MQGLLRSAAAFAPLTPRSPFSPLVATNEVRAELLRNFFPAGADYGMDLTDQSALPPRVVLEMRQLFPERFADNPFFSLENLIQSMYDVVVFHCVNTPLIQQHGNAAFRQVLRDAAGAAVIAALPQELHACAEADQRLLAGRDAAVQQLLTVQAGKSARAPLRAESDVIATDTTGVAPVASVQRESEYRRASLQGPQPLLQWDDRTRQLVNILFGALFAFGIAPSAIINRPPEGPEREMYGALLAHFGSEFTGDDVNVELQFAASAVCVGHMGTAIHAYLRRKLDSLFRAIALSLPFTLPNPIIQLSPFYLFPRDVRHTTAPWPISFSERPIEGRVPRQRWIEFIDRDFGATFRPFLTADEMPDVFGGRRDRIQGEANRCFFVHLGAALGLHPVWLQVINLRRTI